MSKNVVLKYKPVVAWIGVISQIPKYFPIKYIYPIDSNSYPIARTVSQTSSLILTDDTTFLTSSPKQIILVGTNQTSINTKMKLEESGYLTFIVK